MKMADQTRRFNVAPRWARSEHPIFHLETQRRALNGSILTLSRGCLPLVLAVLGLVFFGTLLWGLDDLLRWATTWRDLGDVFMSALGRAMLAVLLVQFAIGAMTNVLVIALAAPTISGEVELQSWRLLRTTTMPLREVILAKYAAVIRNLRGPLGGLVILRASSLGTLLLLFGYYLSRDVFYYMGPLELRRFVFDGLWLPPLIPIALFVVYYAAQPWLQFYFNSALGMAASAFARSRANAVVVGLTVRLVLWVLSVMVGIAALFFIGFVLAANWAAPRYAPMAFFHDWPEPTPLQVSWVISLSFAAWLFAILVWQVVFSLGALAITRWRCRRLAV
jgi:hypothetical protein